MKDGINEMIELTWILGSTLAISLFSLLGIISLLASDRLLNRILLVLVGFSAGTLLGGAFLHLLPESIEKSGNPNVFLFLLMGYFVFFLLERVLYWRHCHEKMCDVHEFTYLNLFGDGVHNFIDGVIIAASFLSSIQLGIITSFMIAAHEVPQEIGDFGVLVYGGFTRRKALLANLLSALTAVLGGLMGYLFSSLVENMSVILLPFAAGGFVYIASSDLVPELHKERDFIRSGISYLFFLIGVIIMWVIKAVLR